MIDLLIAGGGPAGLATALHATRAGLDVVVFEPRSGPVDKACGEGLMPGAVQALQHLGVDPGGMPFRGIEYLRGARRAAADFPASRGRGVRRTDLQHAMLAACARAGVPILQAGVREVTQDDSGVIAAGVRARYLVAADGLHSPIARRLGLVRTPRRTRHRWGQRRHFTVRPWSERVQVHWSDRGEAYVTPLAADLIGVAVLSTHRTPFDEQLRWFPELAERLADSPAGPVRGAGPFRRRTLRRVEGRVLLVGDAAGYVDALTGEGIAVSLACAEELVRCVHNGRPHRYDARWRRASRRYRALTSALLWASERRVLRDGLVPAAERFPALFSGAVAQLAR